MKNNIVLMGFMATGKTTVGSALAKRLGMGFVDTDDMVEAMAGKTIPEIFAGSGEPGFREIESSACRAASRMMNTVIAIGGGAVTNPENMVYLRRDGLIVCLTASLETILARTTKKGDRPLLRGKGVGEISELLERRRQFYEEADITIDTTNLSVEEVVDEICRKNVQGRNSL